MPGEVPAVNASVRILEMLAEDWPRPVSPSRLVSGLGLNRSTCYNILGTLQGLGWAVNLGDRSGWTLGPRLLSLTGVSQSLSAAVVQDELDEFSRDLGLVVFVAERDGSGGYTVTAKAERQSGVRVTVGVGDQFPFSVPALMQAFEAWTPEDELQRLLQQHGLERFTEHTVTRFEDLRATLEQVRRDRFSSSIRQYDLAQGGVASPVFDAQGRVRVVLCTLAFSSELNKRTARAIGLRLSATADRITERVGGVRPARHEDQPVRSA